MELAAISKRLARVIQNTLAGLCSTGVLCNSFQTVVTADFWSVCATSIFELSVHKSTRCDFLRKLNYPHQEATHRKQDYFSLHHLKRELERRVH